MASQMRQTTDDLTPLDALLDQPEKFNFFQALRLIEASQGQSRRLGKTNSPAQDVVRLKQKVDMAFAPSTIAAYVPAEENGGTAALSAYLFGVFGPNGPMPLHISEYVREREHNARDHSFAAFADMFHHRLISLFYRAWASAEPAASFDRAEDDYFADVMSAFAGLMGQGAQNRDAMPDLSKLRFSGRLSNGTKNEEGLLAIITEFFKMPVDIESFVGSWLELEPTDHWQLGIPSADGGLGFGTSLGARVWSRQSKFRIHFGPLDFDDYKRLLPGGISLYRLQALVRNYIGDMLDWDVSLQLKPAQAPQVQLGKQGELGWVGWLGKPDPKKELEPLLLVIPMD